MDSWAIYLGDYIFRPAKIKNLFYLAEFFFFRPGKIELIFYLAEIEKNKIIQFGQIKKKIKYFWHPNP